MGDFLPDGLPTFKVVSEVFELTGFIRFELWIAELFNKLPSITLKKLLATRGFLIRKVLVLNNQLKMLVAILQKKTEKWSLIMIS